MASISSQLMNRLIRSINPIPYTKANMASYHARNTTLREDCLATFVNKVKAEVGFLAMIPIAAAEAAITGSALAVAACYRSGENMEEMREQFKSSLFTMGWSSFNATFNFLFYAMVEQEDEAREWGEAIFNPQRKVTIVVTDADARPIS